MAWKLNRNIGCIEIDLATSGLVAGGELNRNIGCIEIRLWQLKNSYLFQVEP